MEYAVTFTTAGLSAALGLGEGELRDIKVETLEDGQKVVRMKVADPSKPDNGKVAEVKDLPLHFHQSCGHATICWSSLSVMPEQFEDGIKYVNWSGDYSKPERVK